MRSKQHEILLDMRHLENGCGVLSGSPAAPFG
jgi:hypothetical protein